MSLPTVIPGDTSTSASSFATPSSTFSSPYIAAARLMVNQWKDERLKNLRPIGEFFAKEKFSVPKIIEIPTRLKANVTYYQTNYFLVFFLLSIYSALTSPIFLIAIILVGGVWLYSVRWRTGPFVLAGRQIPEQVITIVLLIVTLLMFYLSSGMTILWWLLIVAGSFVFLHALFHNPQPIDEFGFGLPSESAAFTNV